MVVKIVHDSGKHYNLHEGAHIGFHPKGNLWEDGVTVVVEGRGAAGIDSITIEIEKGSNTKIFLMNNQGKTIEKIYV